jgi:hypothetical protein
MRTAVWIATTTRLPANGQKVLVKTAHGRLEHRVIFRADPEPRWESASLVAELDLYAYWRPLPPEGKRPAAEARAPGL